MANQMQQPELGTFIFWNGIWRVLHERGKITASFGGHLEVQGNLTFTHANWINANQNKKTRMRIFYILKTLYRVLHERSNITAPSTEHLKFPENMTFAEVFCVKNDKKKEKIK